MILRLGILLTLFFLAASAYGSEQPVEVSRSFTNKDLEQYNRPSEEEAAPQASQERSPEGPEDRKDEAKLKARSAAEKKEQENWCRKATQINRKIALAGDKVNEQKAHLDEVCQAEALAFGAQKSQLARKRAQAEKALKASGKRLRERQEDLAELEGEAHRSSIPPGWLRCQFE